MGVIIDQIRDAVRESGLRRTEISKQTGISNTMLSRLLSGERGFSVDAVERVAKFLKLEITIRPSRKKRG